MRKLAFTACVLAWAPLSATAQSAVMQACEAYGAQSARTQGIAGNIGIDLGAFCTCVETGVANALPDPVKFAEELVAAYIYVADEAVAREMEVDAVYEAMDSDGFVAGASEADSFRRFEMKDRIRSAHSYVMRSYRIDNACPA